MSGGAERSIVGTQVFAGAVGGIAAWGVGYLVTYVLYGPRLEADVVSTAVEPWQIAGLLFFNAHAVATEIVQPFDVTTTNFLVGDIAPRLLYILPPVALGLAGLFVAHTTEPGDDLEANARAGATVVFGYGVLCLVGLFAFVASTDTTQFRPEPVGAVLIAGVLYPLAFGAMGGFGAAFVR